ncbi:pantoate--beta-alanine ligase, partial [Wohlfahrtiimonas larvae]
LYLIREMVEELNMPIKIVAVPICRDNSGLALSSRNGYLSSEEKERAIELSQCLTQMKHTILDSNLDFRLIEAQAIQSLNNNGWVVDYISIRDQTSLAVADHNNGQLIILAAAKMGKTRLLDNLMV